MKMKATINVYEYKDLKEDAKFKVIWWLDKYPIEYDCEDENGNTITKYQYFADAEDYEVQEHCEVNGYLFTIEGDCIHHLIQEQKNEVN
tara:strand:+ start:183 stop:449 length:267 start_codon:yes stop_codon:yes gene_type:complete